MSTPAARSQAPATIGAEPRLDNVCRDLHLQSPNDAITLEEFANAYEAIQSFADQSFDGAVSAKIVRLCRWGLPHYRRYVEARGAVAEKLGEKIVDGKYRVTPEKMPEFNQAMAPIRAETISIDPALKLDVQSLEGVRVTPYAVEALGPFLAGL